MSLLVAFITLVGFVGSIFTIYEFIQSRTRHSGGAQQRAVVAGVITVALIVGSVIFANVLPQSSIPKSSPTPAPSTGNLHTPPSVGVTPTVTPSPPPSPSPAPIPTLTPTPTPSPTPPPPGTILYQADWSNGLNGWKGSPDWKVLNGMLLSDGSNGNIIDGPTIVPPYQVSNTADYAIEANIQLISYGYVGEGSSSFGISLRGTSTTNGWQGYTGGLLAFNQYQRYMQITGPDIFDALKRGDFDPGSTSPHTYRVEVKGNDIKLLIDGSIRLEVTDNRYLSGAQVGLWCFGPQINVSSFEVFAL